MIARIGHKVILSCDDASSGPIRQPRSLDASDYGPGHDARQIPWDGEMTLLQHVLQNKEDSTPPRACVAHPQGQAFGAAEPPKPPPLPLASSALSCSSSESAGAVASLSVAALAAATAAVFSRGIPYSIDTSCAGAAAVHEGILLPLMHTSQILQAPSMQEYLMGTPDARATSLSFCPATTRELIIRPQGSFHVIVCMSFSFTSPAFNRSPSVSSFAKELARLSKKPMLIASGATLEQWPLV
eukprot:CAMPEP_0183375078 /NCGR_PEP_ID=MMETSP0164_2-20130417/116372_1 /TAXON_ID=221442 /ORGANISM="Coccolithus pelagicus ssp braarudi, Strain PLY182g" /LENGTH=241 /DNA_ID=CAMNT_0025552199 /DNA_START=159 /DNA_END=885 /DNA_ORIENTATION=-